MSEQGLSKYITATIAAAATCLVLSTGAQAIEVNDDPRALFQMASTTCHPARGACAKIATRVSEERREVAQRNASAVQPYGDTIGGVCHPAYRPCANWAYWAREYPVTISTN